MHIIRLEAENIKRLEAVTITPDGNMIVIGGPNGAGKSSTLDAIEMALGGKGHVCKKPIHEGAESGFVIVETEEYTVTRRFTQTDSYIEVKNKDGFKSSTPQALLDKWVGDLSFDPLAFIRMKPQEQIITLMRILKLDFTELDAEYERIEQQRRDIGRDGKAIKAQLDAIALDADAPTAEVVVSDLVGQLESIRVQNAEHVAVRSRVTDGGARFAVAQVSVTRLESQLREAIAERDRIQRDIDAAKEAAEGLVDTDTAPLTEQIANAETVNRRVRAAVQRKHLADEYAKMSDTYKTGTASLEEIVATKAGLIAAADFPVKGMTFGSDGILVNGIPFDQASSAEQLQIAVAMGLSANPELRIILIRDGSLLDETSMAAMAEMAENYEAQVFIERVADGQDVSVVIRDGREGPKVFQDGDKWCALLGENIQDGQAAFGDTKDAALKQWYFEYAPTVEDRAKGEVAE